MKKYITLSILTLLSAGCIAISWIAPFYLLWSIVFTVGISLSLIFLIITTFKFEKLYKLALTLNIIGIVVVTLFTIFYYTGLLSHFSSLEEARKWFESFGAWAWIIFFLIQIAQVVILPIPAQITTIAGVLMFGPWITFIISAIAIIIGSLICFALGRYFGVKIAYKIASKEVVDKYRKILTQKGKVLLPVMFLFPAFPDDLLCFIAGTTKLTWKYFIIVTLVTRLIAIACICWLGSGELIPFSGWGIPVWIVLGILILITVILLFKYQEQFEEWIIKIFTKNGKQKIKKKHDKEKEQEIIKNIDEKTNKNEEEYVNFEDSKQTKDDYINFESLENSNGSKENIYNDKKNKNERT